MRLCINQFQRCPSPPRATAGHLLMLPVPGVGHSQFYLGSGGWALAYPGATPGHLTHAFSKDEFIGRTRPLSKTVHQGPEKVVSVSVKDTIRKAVDWSPRRREERRWHNCEIKTSTIYLPNISVWKTNLLWGLKENEYKKYKMTVTSKSFEI